MRFSLLTVALLVSTTPVAAQKPGPPPLTPADTAAILRAADSTLGVASVSRVVGDTVWVLVEQRHAPPPQGSVAFDALLRKNAVRVHRRNGEWVRVRPDGTDTTLTKP